MQAQFTRYIAQLTNKFINRIKLGSLLDSALVAVYNVFVGDRISECGKVVVDFPDAKYCKSNAQLKPYYEFEVGNPVTPPAGVYMGYYDLLANANIPADAVNVAAEINADNPTYTLYSFTDASTGQLINVPVTLGTLVIAYNSVLPIKTILNSANIDISNDFVVVQEVIDGVVHYIHIATTDISIPVIIKAQ